MNTGTGNTLKGTVLLFTAALIWGSAFVVQSVGMDYVGPFTFTGSRNLIGSAVLLPFILIRGKMAPEPAGNRATDRRFLITGGAVCGVLLCIAANLQQIGIQYTTVGKAGFITAMYIVIVPLLGIFLGRKTGALIWISVALAVAGLYLLSMKGSFSLQRGDAFMLMCAFAFAFQITAIDHYVKQADGVKLACLEFLVCGVLSCLAALLTEKITADALYHAAVPILYAGVLSSGVAYTFQILGQKELRPAVASLIMSFESVISALSGWLLLGQKLTLREICGCVIIFAAIVLAQMPHGGK